jgi:transcriptional regulator of acetoin/glycerol metabolism
MPDGRFSVSEAAATTSPARHTEDGLDGNSQLVIVGLNGEPTLVELGAERLLLGRGVDCDVRLTSGEVSRHHAEIVRVGPLSVVRDLDSRNGTFLKRVRVKEGPLVPQTTLRIGDWIGVVIATPPGRARPSAFLQHGPGLWGGETLDRALAPARDAARSDVPIVIEGETGTGKELVARAIHEWSGRTGPFLAVNCGALPDGLVEAELFGYRRGAFTGADRASAGHFREAQGGTLLLDEICDLPLPVQVKLLRVLEQREVVPLGESRPVPIDVRIVAAAQHPLQRAVEQQRFRADLRERLGDLTVRLPALRERVEDVERLLAQFMCEVRPGPAAPMLSVNALETLCTYDWPGNVRELRMLARKLSALHPVGTMLHRRDLPESMRLGPAPDPHSVSASGANREGSKFDRFIAALRAKKGNVAQAAVDAGISRPRAYRLMKAHPEIDFDAFRRSSKEV